MPWNACVWRRCCGCLAKKGWGLPGDGVDCHQIAIMFYQLASLGDLHGYPILVKHPPYDWSVRTHMNWNQSSACRSNINETINLQKGWTMHAEEPGIVNTNHESMPGFTPWFGDVWCVSRAGGQVNDEATGCGTADPSSDDPKPPKN